MKAMRLSCLLAATAALLFAGCKPTEKNYKAAYDAAMIHKENSLADRGVTVPLQGDASIALRKVGSDSIWVSHSRFSIDNPDSDGQIAAPGRYGVAVASFRMPTNARAMSSDLRKKGYKSVAATDGREKWVVVADFYSSLEEAAAGIREFQKRNPQYIYVGQPAPVVVLLR